MRVEVGGVGIEVGDGGAGTPVVLLHGFPFSSAIFEPVRPELERVCRLLTPDLRGFGGSDTPEGDYSMGALASDVARLLDELGVERYVLGGHSMGGYVALRLAAMRPEGLLGLVLVDSKAAADPEEGRLRRAAAIEAIRAEGGEAYVRSFVPAAVGETTRHTRPALLERLRELGAAVPDHVLVACQQAMAARPDSSDLFRTLEVPTLVVLGEEDAMLGLEAADALASSARKGHLAVIPRAGHTPSMEQPEATAKAVLGFLRTNGLLHG